MDYQNLQLTSSDGILILTISREKALNALNGQTMQELKHFFGTHLPAQEDVKGGSGYGSRIKGICSWRRYQGVSRLG